MGIQNGTATLEDSLAVSYKTKFCKFLTLSIQSINHAGIYSMELKTYPHKNLHTDVNSSFIHNCQNLEAAKMYFSR